MSYDIATLNTEVDLTSKVDSIVIRVKESIEALDLDNLPATEEKKKEIKKIRADLNKEVAVYETEIKKIDGIINKGLNELKKQYKDKIKTLYTSTDKKLKKKIDEITDKQLQENLDYSKEYYADKKKAMPLRLGIKYKEIPFKFKFNSSKTSIRKTVNAHFEKIEKALAVIDEHEFKTQLEEIWIKKDYDLGESLVELQTQITMANKILKQKEEAKLQKEKEDAIVEQAKARIVRKEPAPEIIKTVIKNKPVVEKMLVVEEINDYAFEIEMTDKQLEEFVDYMMERDITFTLVE